MKTVILALLLCALTHNNAEADLDLVSEALVVVEDVSERFAVGGAHAAQAGQRFVRRQGQHALV